MEDQYRKLKLSVSNAQPGTYVTVNLTEEGAGPVAYSTGPTRTGSPGISIKTIGDTLPLNTFNITPAQVKLETQSGGDGGALKFDVELYLWSNNQSIKYINLASSSGPGVQIMASVDNATALPVGTTPTMFRWDMTRSNDS
ncbi:hypothetical protein [Paraherbaspirillum soli]|uniref:Uncharacterized protein n=1 Tax=Paraherbaspirillum soli TaxID=631222 RepID=A0ABW0MBN0_9BURK